MGAGKTTVGEALAARLAWPFVDLDTSIEESAGLALREIFDTLGEVRFRQLESEGLRRTGALAACVVATGGGTPVDRENRAWMQAHGRVVWLDVAFEEVATRLRDDRRRPLYSDREAAALLFEQRRPAYSENDLAVHVEGRSAAGLAVAIADALGLR
ncbi:MAG: shikimate kinase [Acidobacteria bacterium]|nr:shikimate kinase [Acidobacteriota bacterium]